MPYIFVTYSEEMEKDEADILIDLIKQLLNRSPKVQPEPKTAKTHKHEHSYHIEEPLNI